MKIEFGVLKIGETARRHLEEAVNNNWVTMGPKVKQFEEEWGKLFCYNHSIAVSSGTDADLNCCVALYDLGANIGDEIILPALSFISPANSVRMAGFTPVFVDVDRRTMNIDPNKIEVKITPKTKAIMAIHTMGKPCDMERINEIAKRHSLYVVEDACEAHGAKYKGEYVGHWGDMVTFSFFSAHLICCGEGGMVSTDDGRIASILRSTRNHGRREGSLYFDHVRFAFNSKMNDLEASLGLEGVEQFWSTFNARKSNLNYLLQQTADLDEFAFFNLEEPYEVTCPHAFSVTLRDPKLDYRRLYSHLESSSIHCKRNFGSVPTQHRAFAYLRYKLGEFPEAEYVGDNGLHIGVHPFLSKDDLDYVSEVLHSYFSKV